MSEEIRLYQVLCPAWKDSRWTNGGLGSSSSVLVMYLNNSVSNASSQMVGVSLESLEGELKTLRHDVNDMFLVFSAIITSCKCEYMGRPKHSGGSRSVLRGVGRYMFLGGGLSGGNIPQDKGSPRALPQKIFKIDWNTRQIATSFALHIIY